MVCYCSINSPCTNIQWLNTEYVNVKCTLYMYNERWKGHFTLYRHGCRKAALKHQTPSNFLQFQMLNLSLTLLKDQNARRDWAQSSEFGDNQISGSWVLCWVNYHQLATTGCSTILEPIAFWSYLSQTFESLDVISHISFGWFKTEIS